MSAENKQRIGALAVAFIGTFLALYAYNEYQKRKEAKALEVDSTAAVV